jgi:hypothetical protein
MLAVIEVKDYFDMAVMQRQIVDKHYLPLSAPKALSGRRSK